MTPEELDRLERLCAAWPDYRPGATDTWIAAARVALPDLIAEVRRLTTEAREVDEIAGMIPEVKNELAAFIAKYSALKAEVERPRMALKLFAEEEGWRPDAPILPHPEFPTQEGGDPHRADGPANPSTASDKSPPASASVPGRAKPCNWVGGNDYAACTVCGQEYDWRKTERPACLAIGRRGRNSPCLASSSLCGRLTL